MRKYIRAVATAVLAVIVSGATLSVFAAMSVCTPEQLAAITNDLAGGFVGYTADSPVILRCRAWGNVDNFSGKSGTGGFVGNHSGGSITDCCALMECSATDNGDASAGGFAGLVASARIATSLCSGEVDSLADYVGAFVGNANGAGLITSSYYDTVANGEMKAAWKPAIVERPPRLFFKWRISFDW